MTQNWDRKDEGDLEGRHLADFADICQILPMFDIDKLIFHAEVTLDGIAPPITRTLELPQTLNLAELHEVLQAAFGWTDSHLHEFVIGGLSFGAPETDDGGYEGSRRTFEATDVHLYDFRTGYGRAIELSYIYDFGDNWVHTVALKLVQGDDQTKRPCCIGGSRSGPPEDSGGTQGYSDLVDVLKDPSNEEYKEMRRWVGRKFDPEYFDLEATNKAIRLAMRRSRGDYRFRQE